ncbi:MAG: hypothetical protein L0170_18045, partial [Acidobacteria bacterium]|nr:hypothetical protein [Acidobacteriota bacterium]
PGAGIDNEFTRYLTAVAEGSEEQFRAAYPYRIDPVSDDSPFFFNFHRLRLGSEVSRSGSGAGDTYLAAIGKDPVGLMLLATALLESTLLVIGLVILPLFFSRRLAMPRQGRVSVLCYFLGLGVGFLFLEIACMQRFSLYLGHPTRSITVILFSFLLFSGLGSAWTGLWPVSRRRPLQVILVLIALYAAFLPRLLEATLGLSTLARILITIAVLGVPSFFMGMPFPLGLSRLQGERAPFLPWAFAINGGASVIASVAAIFLAMAGGFTLVFWLSLLFYAVAWFASAWLPGSPRTAAQ